MNSDKFSLKSRLESFKFAFRGLLSLIKNEHNSRIHLLAAIVAIFVGIILKISLPEWSFLTIAIGLVFLTELVNSSIEALADIVDSELNEGIGKAKDYAAAAVLVSALIAVIVGGVIFIPKIFALI